MAQFIKSVWKEFSSFLIFPLVHPPPCLIYFSVWKFLLLKNVDLGVVIHTVPGVWGDGGRKGAVVSGRGRSLSYAEVYWLEATTERCVQLPAGHVAWAGPQRRAGQTDRQTEPLWAVVWRFSRAQDQAAHLLSRKRVCVTKLIWPSLIKEPLPNEGCSFHLHSISTLANFWAIF